MARVVLGKRLIPFSMPDNPSSGSDGIRRILCFYDAIKVEKSINK